MILVDSHRFPVVARSSLAVRRYAPPHGALDGPGPSGRGHKPSYLAALHSERSPCNTMLKLNSTLLASLTVSAAICLLSAGCSLTPPTRTPYSGADTVGEINPDMLLGSWNVRVLNPLEGEEGNQTDASYHADGTVVVNSRSNNEGMSLAMRMLGRWRIEGDMVMLSMESIEETSGNAMAALMIPMLNSYKDRANGSANVYESSDGRLIMVVTDGGQAQELTRR